MTWSQRIVDTLADEPGEVAVEPPGSGDGFWAGGPSIVHDDGVFHLAYRLRRPVDQGRGYANVVARSEDGGNGHPHERKVIVRFHSAELKKVVAVLEAAGFRVIESVDTNCHEKH